MTTSTTVATAIEAVATESLTVTETVKRSKGKEVTVRTVQATDAMLTLVKRYAVLMDRAAAIKAEQDEIKSALGEVMRADGVDRIEHAGRVRVTRSVSTPKRVDTARLREDYPDLAEALTYQGSPEERFTFK